MALADASQFKAPPSTRTAKTSPRTSAAKSAAPAGSSRLAAREEAANGIFQLAGFACIVFKQYADAGAIGNHSAAISHEAAKLAETNEGVGKALDYLMEAGPYAGLVTAMLPLAMQLAANHNMIKAEYVSGAGVVSPDALTAQVKADMARHAQESLIAQKTAEKELAALKSERDAMNSNGHVKTEGK